MYSLSKYVERETRLKFQYLEHTISQMEKHLRSVPAIDKY